MRIKIILLIVAINIFSCKKETLLVDTHQDYFPVKIGTWVIYDVDSTFYDDFMDSVFYFTFQVKEVIESEFIDNEGRSALRIERYYRDSSEAQWVIKDVWTANRTNKTAELVENNIRYIKLIFPIIKNSKWNGNNANILDENIYEYTDIHTPYTVQNNTFDSCLIVQHENELTLFTQKFSKEVYAKNIGKIYKNHINIEKLADGTIVSGFDYSYKIVSWGN